MKYVLEPMLFAIDDGLSEQELTHYLEGLLALDDWCGKHREDIFIQGSTSDVLYSNNYYPTRDTLIPLLEKHRIESIQYRDVEKIIVKMLTRSRMIELLFGDSLLNMKSRVLKHPMKVHPGVKRPKDLHDVLLTLLWNVFLAHELGGYDEKSFVVITRGISDIVSVEYKYEVLVEDKGKWALVDKTDEQEVNCKASLADFLRDENTPFYLWKTAERKEDLDLGVRVSLMQNDDSDISNTYLNYSFLIQDSFYRDYCDGHYKSKDSDIRSTIQAVTDALTDQKMRKVHAIKKGGAQGNNPPLVVQNYDAQRRNITTSIKLAYWKKGKEFKIANMREHDFYEPTWEE